MTSYERKRLQEDLGAALAAPNPASQVTEVIRQALVRDDDEWPVGEGQLEKRLVERLDAVVDDPERLLQLTSDLQQLLGDSSSDEEVELLLELVAERARAAAILKKYTAGIISRTSLLSYIAEQRWPDAIRHRIPMLSTEGLTQLTSALEDRDIPLLSRLLIG